MKVRLSLLVSPLALALVFGCSSEPAPSSSSSAPAEIPKIDASKVSKKNPKVSGKMATGPTDVIP